MSHIQDEQTLRHWCAHWLMQVVYEFAPRQWHDCKVSLDRGSYETFWVRLFEMGWREHFVHEHMVALYPPIKTLHDVRDRLEKEQRERLTHDGLGSIFQDEANTDSTRN